MSESHTTQSQEAIFAFLSDPTTHGGAGVTRIDTHGAAVFLAGDRVQQLVLDVDDEELGLVAGNQHGKCNVAGFAPVAKPRDRRYAVPAAEVTFSAKA